MTGLALIFLALSWSYMRSLNSGGALRPSQKKILLYSFIFALGMCYLMLLVGDMHWPKSLSFPMIGIWGVVVGFLAWWRYRQSRNQNAPETSHKPVSAVLAEVLPAVGLLICVIAGAVEWESIFEGQGRWWVGVLWLAGVGASIVAARHNRRTTVIVVLRGVLALLIIGAIAQRTPPALVAAAISGLALLLLEKFWHSNPNGRDQNSAGRG
ncbi:MAG TPA: hypothetical protein VG892_04160 [Terriglobales bacterium]|nr:hypothetical protein [Terriglobales bacterium]